jgi:hypothetical protein
MTACSDAAGLRGSARCIHTLCATIAVILGPDRGPALNRSEERIQVSVWWPCRRQPCPDLRIDACAKKCLDSPVIAWCLVEVDLGQPVDLFTTREEAEDVLDAVLRDEPDWQDLVVVEPVELRRVQLGFESPSTSFDVF